MNTIAFEPLSFDHAPFLHDWLQQPHVMEFWDDGDRSLESVKERYYERSDVKAWIACVDGVPFAYLQIYFVTDQHAFRQWKTTKNPTLGLDFFIGDSSYLGRGLSAILLEHFIEDVIKVYLPCRLLVDPEVHNLKAQHIYKKIGFQLIGEFKNQDNSYRILKKDLSDRCVQIHSYDPNWPKTFEEEAQLLKEALGVNCGAVHHFGSTSVPGLSAKPKIDILAVVKEFSSIKVPLLIKIGYEVRREVVPTGRYFVKDHPCVNLHVFEEGNTLIEKNLKFRDWLRTHPEDVAAYAVLKQTLAIQYKEHNGRAYSFAKTQFIEEIIKKADQISKRE